MIPDDIFLKIGWVVVAVTGIWALKLAWGTPQDGGEQ
jgi:hypothetical protein